MFINLLAVGTAMAFFVFEMSIHPRNLRAWAQPMQASARRGETLLPTHVYACMRIYMAGKPEFPNIGLHTVTQLLAVVVCINKSSTPRNYNPIRICSSGWLTTKEVASGRGDCDQLMTVIPSEQLTNLWKKEFVSSALLVQTSHATPSCEETPLSYKVYVEERVHSGDGTVIRTFESWAKSTMIVIDMWGNLFQRTFNFRYPLLI